MHTKRMGSQTANLGPQTADLGSQTADLTPPPQTLNIERPLPAELADVALVDAATCAAAASIGQTAWFELVRAGRAPQPVFRGTRCTRWRLAEVRAWLATWRGMGA